MHTFQVLCVILAFLPKVISSSNLTSCPSSQDPYIYLTVHDEIQNVLKYTLNGCLVSTSVGTGGGFTKSSELRSMSIGTHKGEEALFVADGKLFFYSRLIVIYIYKVSHTHSVAQKSSSVVLIFGGCQADGTRKYIDHTPLNQGGEHTYGITFDSGNNIYASYQHTDNVLRYAQLCISINFFLFYFLNSIFTSSFKDIFGFRTSLCNF